MKNINILKVFSYFGTTINHAVQSKTLRSVSLSPHFHLSTSAFLTFHLPFMKLKTHTPLLALKEKNFMLLL